MVNVERWNAAYSTIRQLDPELYFVYEDCTDKMLESLGDDESAALDFLKGLDEEAKEYLYSFDEEILEKFHSDEMQQFIESEVVQPAKDRSARYFEEHGSDNPNSKYYRGA